MTTSPPGRCSDAPGSVRCRHRNLKLAPTVAPHGFKRGRIAGRVSA